MKLWVVTRSIVLPVVMLLAAAGFSSPAMAAEDTFKYDDNGRLIQVVGEDGQTVDYFYDEAGNLVKEVRQGSRVAVTLCADLSHPKKDSFPDRDVYSFIGRAGELVTVRVMADPPENGMGFKAALTLRDRTVTQSQRASDFSVLPNAVSMILEKDGVYEVEIHGQKQVFQDERYSGPYCVTLEAEPSSADSFKGL